MGPPGSGKGTQARFLAKEQGYHCLSMGVMLRTLSLAETPEARRLQGMIDQGVILDDAFVIGIVEESLGALSSEQQRKLVFDGVPRTLGQAHLLDKLLQRYNIPLDWSIYFGSDPSDFQKIFSQRISNRYHCLNCGASYGTEAPPQESGKCDVCCSESFAHRRDDAPEIVHKRLERHQQEEDVLLAYYRESHRLYVINSLAPVNEVKQNLKGLKARGVSVSF